MAENSSALGTLTLQLFSFFVCVCVHKKCSQGSFLLEAIVKILGGIWLGVQVSDYLASHPAVLDTLTGSVMNLFKSYDKYGIELRYLNI